MNTPAMAPGLVSVCKGNVTLMQLIGNGFRNTPTPEEIVCEGCQLSNEATLSRFLKTAPSYLFVHLKRFQYDDSENGKIETALPEEGEVAGNPSSNPEADCAFINRAERLERELQEATELLEELITSSRINPAVKIFSRIASTPINTSSRYRLIMKKIGRHRQCDEYCSSMARSSAIATLSYRCQAAIPSQEPSSGYTTTHLIQLYSL